jgi:hypothetical protein
MFFQKVNQGQMIVNFVFSNSLLYLFIPILKEIIFLNPTIVNFGFVFVEYLQIYKSDSKLKKSEFVKLFILGLGQLALFDQFLIFQWLSKECIQEDHVAQPTLLNITILFTLCAKYRPNTDINEQVFIPDFLQNTYSCIFACRSMF